MARRSGALETLLGVVGGGVTIALIGARRLKASCFQKKSPGGQFPTVGDEFYIDEMAPSSSIASSIDRDGRRGGLVKIVKVELLRENACLCSVYELSANFQFLTKDSGLFSWTSPDFQEEQSRLKRKFGLRRARRA